MAERTSQGGFAGRQSLLGSGVLSMGQAVWSLILGLVTVPIMLRYLGYTDYGLYSLAFAVAGFGSFLDLGLSWTIAKFAAEADTAQNEQELACVFQAGLIFSAGVGLLFFVGVVAASPWLVSSVLHIPFLDAPNAVSAVRIAASSFFCTSVASLLIAGLRGLRRFRAATLISMASLTVSVCGAAIAASIGFGLRGAAIGQLTGAMLGLLLSFLACTKILCTAVSISRICGQLSGMLSFSIWNYLGRLIQIVALQGDKLMVARLAGPAMLPSYAVPFTIAQKVNFVGGPAVTAFYPTAAIGRRNTELFRQQYHSTARLLHILTAAAAISVVCLGDLFLRHWLGERMADEGSLVLRIFTIGYWLVSVGSLDAGCLEAWNRPDLVCSISGAALVLGVIVAFGGASLTSAQYAIACGVSTWLAITGLGQMLAWKQVAKANGLRLRATIARPLLEMVMLGIGFAIAWHALPHGKFFGLLSIPSSILILSLFGLWRAFSKDEISTLCRRLVDTRMGREI